MFAVRSTAANKRLKLAARVDYGMNLFQRAAAYARLPI